MKGCHRQVDKLHNHSHNRGVSEILKLSPLDQEHRDLGARLVPFAGWEMPVRYDSIIEEHCAVRDACGVFDISHMGQVFASGAKVVGWLDGLLTNEVAALEPGNAHYTFMLNEQGGVIDDLILYRLADELFLLLVNASCLKNDVAWLEEHLKKGITLENESSEWAGLAVQGPNAPEVYTAITEGRTLPARNGVDDLKHEGERLLICRTGYTGEDGFELFCPAGQASRWWKALLAEGVKPCGLGARDSLRLEMCYPLNGADLSTCRTPLEAGLGFFVSLKKGDFMGSAVLKRQKEEGCAERLMAIKMTMRAAPPRPGYAVLDEEGNALSALTSGGLSPTLGEGIALAYLPVARAKINTPLFIDVRGRKISAKVVKKPFYRK
jgi:aminomethyltransferase